MWFCCKVLVVQLLHALGFDSDLMHGVFRMNATTLRAEITPFKAKSSCTLTNSCPLSSMMAQA